MRFIFTFLFSSFLLLVNAQNIQGKVQDKIQKALPEALIFVENNGSSFYSDNKGQFSIPTEGLEKISLVIFKEGYKDYRVQLSKKDFGNALNITLLQIEQQIQEVSVVRKKKTLFGYTRIKSIEGTTIYSTKKAEIVDMESINANIANNSSRQIFAKVSGLNIWESDCSGIQLGIGSRGLSPSRTSNFNVRQNGYDISADAIGYPDAYYAPPMQALQSIEVVKGAASLQYGTQFGGLINFKLKDAPKDKKIQLNTSLTYGTNKYLNSFTSLAGTVEKLSYYTYFQYRKGDCWRCNSEFDSKAAFAKVSYQENEKLSFSLEYSYLNYLAHQPGGLTDYLFEEDPQQSIRDRNWFKVFWNLANFKMNYKISPKTTLDLSLLGQYSGRDASGYLGKISRTDPLTETDLLQDTYTNYIAEARLLQKYNLFGKRMVFVGGIRYMQGITTKKQGATSNDSIATFKYLNPNNLEGSDFSFPNRNVSIFTENIFNITEKFSLTFGARVEYLNQKATGYYRLTNLDFAGNVLLDTTILETNYLERLFPFFGGGASYKFNKNLEVYTNFSQNYRAVGYNDLRITNPNLVIDENLADEKGFNFDLGVKGSAKNELIFYDGNFFILNYSNKIGTYFTTVPDPVLINRVVRYRTNISSAISYGVELFAQADIYRLLAKKKENAPVSLAVFTNISLINAIYTNSQQTAFKGKKIEDVPPFTLRTGLDFRWKKLSMGTQFSYTQQHYSDATNTEFSADAIVGVIPSYYTLDFNAGYSWKMLKLEVALNNLTNNKYFTQRADGYPGPGILPADAFNANVTLSVEL